MKQLILSISFLLVLAFGQSAYAQNMEIAEEDKPQMLVVSANYGLILGYNFYIEHRGAKKTGRKDVYRKLEDVIIKMGNPSDAMNLMDELGYELVNVYNFPKGEDSFIVNYIFHKRVATE